MPFARCCLVVLLLPVALVADEAPASRRAAYRAASDKEFSYGNLSKAIELIEKACAISRVHPGEWTPEHSDDLSKLARLQLERDDLPSATATMEKVVAIRRKAEAQKPWRIALATSTLRYYKRVGHMTSADHRLLQSAAVAFHVASAKDRIGSTRAAVHLAAQGIEERRKAVGYVDKPLAEEILLQAKRLADLGEGREAERLFD